MHLDTAEYDKWLGNRLGEILEVTKKDNLSEMERDTGIGRRKIERIIYKGRRIKEEEFEPICRYIGISLERFLCQDVENIISEIKKCMYNHNIEQAVDNSLQYTLKAIGYTEKADAELFLGEALLVMKKYNEAFLRLKKGHENALKSGVGILIEKSSKLLLDYYFYNEMYHEMDDFIKKIMMHKVFTEDKGKMGKLYHYLGMSAYYLGKEMEALSHFERSIDCYKDMPENDIFIARLKTSIAEIEYNRSNFSKSKELLLEALEGQKTDRLINRLLTCKDIVRSMVALYENENAILMTEQCLNELSAMETDTNSIRSKFILVKIFLEHDYSQLDEILDNRSVIDDDILTMIADHVVQVYFEGGDIGKDIASKFYSVLREKGNVVIKKFVGGRW